MRPLLVLALLAVPPVAVADPVPGLLDTDTTWTAAASPWVLDVDVTVASGTTLTIEPGAEVHLEAGVSLRIEGSLVARGTPASPIVLTGAPLDGGGTARWRSLIFADGSTDASFTAVDDFVSGSILENALVESGAQGVVTEAASPYLHAVTFRDHRFTPELSAAGAALFIGEGSAPRVRDCLFEDNQAGGSGQGGAIYVDRAQPIIQDNVFRNNKSVYGGAVTTDSMYSPMVGNTFENNRGTFEGGAVAFVSSSLPFLDNAVIGNTSVLDGAGVHVCVTCYPHAFPFLMDNVVTGNTTELHGAAGVGAAYLRVMVDNDVHDNLREGVPVDFAWHNENPGIEPDWVVDPMIQGNWWGSSDARAIEATIEDGADVQDEDPALGVAWYLPFATGPVAAPRTRVTLTTRKFHYGIEGEQMPAYLSLYNPGPARDVELHLLLQIADAPPMPWPGELDFPGATRAGDTWQLALPEDSAWFTVLAEARYERQPALSHGIWHAVMFDSATGERLGPVISSRFELLEEAR